MEDELVIYDDGTNEGNSIETYLVRRTLQWLGEELRSRLLRSPNMNSLQEGITILEGLGEDGVITDNDRDNIQRALTCLDRVNGDDKDFVQCSSWFYKAICHAMLENWTEALEMIRKIDGLEIGLITIKPEIITSIKQLLPELQDAIIIELQTINDKLHTELNNANTELDNAKAELDNVKAELNNANTEMNKAKAELDNLKTELKQLKNGEGKIGGVNANGKAPVPTWAYLTIGSLLVAVTILVCYIVFN